MRHCAQSAQRTGSPHTNTAAVHVWEVVAQSHRAVYVAAAQQTVNRPLLAVATSTTERRFLAVSLISPLPSPPQCSGRTPSLASVRLSQPVVRSTMLRNSASATRQLTRLSSSAVVSQIRHVASTLPRRSFRSSYPSLAQLNKTSASITQPKTRGGAQAMCQQPPQRLLAIASCCTARVLTATCALCRVCASVRCGLH